MSSQEQVPNELWLGIFRCLPTNTLKDLSSTDTRFKGIFRPLLFTHFHLHPFGISPESPEFTRALERLDFWCSYAVAPLVRSCSITPRGRMEASPASRYPLFSLFLERLGQFTGLRELSARWAHLTQSDINLGVSRFSYRVTYGGAAGLWVPLLRPECLRELTLQYTGPFTTTTLFLPRSTLTHLTIRPCTIADFTTQLHGTRGPSRITSLDVAFDNLDMATLSTLCAFFQSLTALRIRITCKTEGDGDAVGANETATEFLAELEDFSTLPEGLHLLAVAWSFEYGSSPPSARARVP
ncbi:hypothetical protein DFH08DRAFT_1026787 [Mycena albidolilacea]|uniref:F-box domain-containing protein n=1 Tax=Mycena albidolilacea TaxID=1033008 RepID=A0AAD6ZKJ9_9AGAR|nr:hypothetical protein DFH08DRAFT_1026787 [Mycena albidolilacea]